MSLAGEHLGRESESEPGKVESLKGILEPVRPRATICSTALSVFASQAV